MGGSDEGESTYIGQVLILPICRTTSAEALHLERSCPRVSYPRLHATSQPIGSLRPLSSSVSPARHLLLAAAAAAFTLDRRLPWLVPKRVEAGQPVSLLLKNRDWRGAPERGRPQGKRAASTQQREPSWALPAVSLCMARRRGSWPLASPSLRGSRRAPGHDSCNV